MLTRITRYTLLVLCLLVAGVWGWSYRYFNMISYDQGQSWLLISNRGYVYYMRFGYYLGSARDGLHFTHEMARPSPDRMLDWKIIQLLGFSYAHDPAPDLGITKVAIPTWMLIIPISLATAALWYRPIRNRLRVKRDAGFEVETKQSEPVKE